MSESTTQTPPESFPDAARIVSQMLRGLETADSLRDQLAPPPEVFDYFFALQEEVEGTGSMNYREYASRMWKKLIPDVSIDSPGFRSFSDLVVTGLHGIDMSKFIHPDITESMPELLKVYQERIEGLAIWSTGDVNATGYQLGKVHKSRIVHNLIGALKQNMGRTERSAFVRDKTSYLVADNKFDSLLSYVVDRLPTDETDEPLKIVIVEDSVSNFDKVREALGEYIASGKVEIVPVWFTGSREGLLAQKQVDDLGASQDQSAFEAAKADLEHKKTKLNAISSFSDLLDTGRFGSIFDGAHVMIDFDGVIGDNIEMRKEQAIVIYDALLSGASEETGLDQPALEEKFLAILRQTPQI